MKVQVGSVRSLYIEMFKDDQSLARGTGFVVTKDSEYYLVTNRHNLAGTDADGGMVWATWPNRVEVHFVKEQQPNGLFTDVNIGEIGEWVEKSLNLYDGSNDPNFDNPLWVEHPVYKNKADFVALPLTDLSGIAVHPYFLGERPCDKFKIPEKVYVVGFPFGKSVGGKFALWSAGTVASEPDFDYENLPCVLIDCKSRRGQSGSPVIRHLPYESASSMGGGYNLIFDNSDLLGIYSGRIHPESELGRVWKRAAIKELIDSI